MKSSRGILATAASRGHPGVAGGRAGEGAAEEAGGREAVGVHHRDRRVDRFGKAGADVEGPQVQDKKKLEGVNPGDKLVITYSEAVAMQVSAPKAK